MSTGRNVTRHGWVNALAIGGLAGAAAWVSPGVLAQQDEQVARVDDPGEPQGFVYEPLDDRDGSDALINGTSQTISIEAGNTHELTFYADDPGLLTVHWSDPFQSVQFSIHDPSRRSLDWRRDLDEANVNEANTSLQFVGIPLGMPGEYTVRLRATEDIELTIGAAWMPFAQVSQGQAYGFEEEIAVQPQVQQAIEPPADEDILDITPGIQQQGNVPRGASNVTFMWLRYTAEEDGELALMLNANFGDLTIRIFEEDEYGNPLEYLDNDLNRSVATEGAVVSFEAGETYMIGVSDLHANGVPVDIRSVWIPDTVWDDQDQAGEAEGDEQGALPEVPVEVAPGVAVEINGNGEGVVLQVQVEQRVIVGGQLQNQDQINQLIVQQLEKLEGIEFDAAREEWTELAEEIAEQLEQAEPAEEDE